VDPARIVYYPRYFLFFHDAFEDFFEDEMGMLYADVIGVDHVGFPSVHVEVDYSAPARFGETLEIHITCARLGTKSVTLRYRAVRVSDGVLSAEALVTTACVDMRTFKSQEIPPKYRKLFSRFAEA
jgi:4-hydroxybenzoyl-CoA thioesterase